MIRMTTASAALLATTALAHAGGVERNAFTTGILFETGNYVELGYTYGSPDVSGREVDPAFGTDPSGDVAPSFDFTTLSFAAAMNDRLTFSLVLDEPIGADVAYGLGPYVFAGSEAELRSNQITAAVRYELTDNVSVFGGLRAARVTGEAFVTTPAFTYRLDDADSDTGYGYMLGAAYEIPDIALRVALTYFSEIDVDFTSRESLTTTALGLVADDVASVFGISLPDSVLLEAQSGVAEGTLVFGSIRWVDWSEFTITPNFYPAAAPDPDGIGGDLAFYRGDTITYTLGVARQLNDKWAVLGSILHEEGNGGNVGNLGPTDGRTALTLGARYTEGPWVISGGIQYSWLGDAQTAFRQTPAPDFDAIPVGRFTNNDALSASLRLGYRF